MKVTLRDIADATGFSISTVSRTLRGEGRISDQNRQEIFSKAHQLDYDIPTGKRKSQKHHTPYIAVITQFDIGEFYASFFNGFSNAAVQKKVQISLFNVSHDVNQVGNLINDLRALGYSGAVIFVPELKERHYHRILQTIPKDFPVISCSNIDNPVLDTVTFDAYRGATLVAEHFYDQGYRELGIIQGPHEKPEARFRTNGFTDFIKHKSESTIIWTTAGDYTHEAGIRAYESFKALPKKPRAIFAANDAMAFGFMESARADGLVLPNDIALAGYDNLPLCDYHFPKLTSVDTNYTMLATNALEYLSLRMDRPAAHQGIVSLVPTSLIVRQSTLSKLRSYSKAKTTNDLGGSSTVTIPLSTFTP